MLSKYSGTMRICALASRMRIPKLHFKVLNRNLLRGARKAVQIAGLVTGKLRK